MPARPRFDADAVRDAWDRAADAYARGQASGRDHYRHLFFGPAHVAACGDVAGARLLDVGCGAGYFAREMASRGARVTAVDISPRMIGHAERQERAAPLGIIYRVVDAACLEAAFHPESFDVVTSCLALQDMPSVETVLRGIRIVLAPGGRLVASLTHPFGDTPYRVWEKDALGSKRWLCVDRYFERGPTELTWNWEGEFVTPTFHATLADWMGWALGAGFRLRALTEPSPTAEALLAKPDLEDAARVPYFLILDLARD